MPGVDGGTVGGRGRLQGRDGWTDGWGEGYAEGQADVWPGCCGAAHRGHAPTQGGAALSGSPSGRHVPCCHLAGRSPTPPSRGPIPVRFLLRPGLPGSHPSPVGSPQVRGRTGDMVATTGQGTRAVGDSSAVPWPATATTRHACTSAPGAGPCLGPRTVPAPAGHRPLPCVQTRLPLSAPPRVLRGKSPARGGVPGEGAHAGRTAWRSVPGPWRASGPAWPRAGVWACFPRQPARAGVRGVRASGRPARRAARHL